MAKIGTRVLAGDIGGTKTVLSLCERRESGWAELATTTFPSAAHPGLEGPALAFLRDAGSPPIHAAAFGVAGPVEDGRVHTTNLPWVVDARALATTFATEPASPPTVAVVNDFEATARGLLELQTHEVVVLQEAAVDHTAPIAVLGAGTGLGQAMLVPTATGARVVATEGGHTDFAPRDEVEDGLLRFLRREFPDHVSYERVLSGAGLAALHAYVVESGLASSLPSTLARLDAEDPGAVIGELGSSEGDAACARAVRMFASIYGAEAGNLALKTLPRGGLYVAGGIAPKLLDVLRSGAFLEAFLAKGRMRPVLETIRVAIVIEPRVALYGARALAASLLEP